LSGERFPVEDPRCHGGAQFITAVPCLLERPGGPY
jgi:hypothetical protein